MPKHHLHWNSQEEKMCAFCGKKPTDFYCNIEKSKTDELFKVILSKANVLKGQIGLPSIVNRDFHNHQIMKTVLQNTKVNSTDMSKHIGSNSQCWIIWNVILVLAVTHDGLDLLEEHFNFETVEFADPMFILTCICGPVHKCLEKIKTATNCIQRVCKEEGNRKPFQKGTIA